MELVGLILGVLLIGTVIGVVLGWLGATHVHQVASAATRATTIPAGDVALAPNLAAAVQSAINAAVQPAVAAAVKSATPPAGK